LGLGLLAQYRDDGVIEIMDLGQCFSLGRPIGVTPRLAATNSRAFG
jgi:hypothetical protein